MKLFSSTCDKTIAYFGDASWARMKGTHTDVDTSVGMVRGHGGIFSEIKIIRLGALL